MGHKSSLTKGWVSQASRHLCSCRIVPTVYFQYISLYCPIVIVLPFLHLSRDEIQIEMPV